MISKQHPMINRDNDEIDVVALLQVIWRYKYFIAAVAVVCGLVAVFLALSATPIYRAEVVVTETRSDGMGGAASLASQFGGLASIAGINLAKGSIGYEAQAVLRSRHLVEEFVRRNDLAAQLLANAKTSPTLWFAVEGFQERVLSITDDKDSGTTAIAIEWTDPIIAARWANEFIALANELMRTRALNDSTRNIKYLNEQIAKTDIVEIQRVMYGLIEHETKTHMLANAREQYAFTIVDPAAVPEQRIWPRRTLMVLTGGVLGILIGIALAFAHNVWTRFRVSAKGQNAERI